MGAPDGLNFEPYWAEFLHLCLHDKDTIEEIKKFLSFLTPPEGANFNGEVTV